MTFINANFNPKLKILFHLGKEHQNKPKAKLLLRKREKSSRLKTKKEKLSNFPHRESLTQI